MNEIKHLERIKTFLHELEAGRIQSTGATVVDFAGVLYNVDGSSDDPKRIPDHNGENWKPLLVAFGIDHDCYVTNAVPAPGASHPAGWLGGHMTTNANGQVANGGTCYLMPLCSWHNSTSRNGVAFAHTETRMLELTGYNLGELPVTFALRLPSEMPFAVLFYENDEWKFKNISHNEAIKLKSSVHKLSSIQPVEHYVLIERKWDDRTTYHALASTLPGA
ncbi:hypothetical protein M8998_01645 [Sphingobacterium sp. lm-10]|uniref:hypothetical protein n=1 Tax=Sphingobacterium sp. lm-10 TaxID=2944904 RepID=UPI0020225786|nr:hypothetical protein [Sphingobacterium sp. lm-10]MCL7986634.1 hypothetical protein [Sphingobacterium sp. lm-10]